MIVPSCVQAHAQSNACAALSATKIPVVRSAPSSPLIAALVDPRLSPKVKAALFFKYCLRMCSYNCLQSHRERIKHELMRLSAIS